MISDLHFYDFVCVFLVLFVLFFVSLNLFLSLYLSFCFLESERRYRAGRVER